MPCDMDFPQGTTGHTARGICFFAGVSRRDTSIVMASDLSSTLCSCTWMCCRRQCGRRSCRRPSHGPPPSRRQRRPRRMRSRCRLRQLRRPQSRCRRRIHLRRPRPAARGARPPQWRPDSSTLCRSACRRVLCPLCSLGTSFMRHVFQASCLKCARINRCDNHKYSKISSEEVAAV